MVAAGYHSGAIDSNGNLYIWGSGSFGEFLKPKKISLPTPVNYIFIRGFFGVAAETNRYQRVYSWGSNSYGELGCGNLESMK
jgi:X-linked retinitis pigmentosa GTPase regulator